MNPSVGVVIPTRDRRDLLYAAITSVRAQQYDGDLTVLVVFDHTEPDAEHAARLTELGVRWIPNTRAKGLPGARNSGVDSLDTALIAFCDDDDRWLPGKLARQVAALEEHPDVGMATTAIQVHYRDRVVPRLAGTQRITHDLLVRDRMAMLHSSTFLFRREFLLDIGMVDEEVPAGQGEDWDLLLRATRDGRWVLNLDEPLVEVLWGRTSFFTYEYATKIEGLDWMVRRHPELRSDARAYARILGQRAFWEACSELPEARTTAAESRQLDRRQWRAYLAPLVARGWVKGETLLAAAHRVGRGI